MGKRGRVGIGTTVITTRTTSAADEGYDPRPALDQAWADVANMEPGAALGAAFKIRGISYIQLSKIVRGETRKLHRCTPGDPVPEEFENFVIARWKGGKYELAPVYKGFLIRRRSWVIGEDPDEGHGNQNTDLAGLDVEAAIAKHVAHKSGLAALREIDAMEKKPEGDDVKTTELMTELLKLERERSARLEDRMERLMDRLNTPPVSPVTAAASGLPSWEALVPVLLGAAAKLPAPLMSRVLGRVMGVVAPAQAPPEGGWTPDAVMTLLSQAAPLFSQLGPLLQGVIAGLTGKTITAPGPDGTVVTALPAGAPTPEPADPQHSRGVMPMPITLSPEGKLALEIAVQHIRDEDYLSAWEALGTSQDTVPFLIGLNPLSKPVSYLPLWLGWLGSEPFMALRGSVMAFIQWAQAHKAELMRAEDDEDDPEPKDDGAPGHDGPAR